MRNRTQSGDLQGYETSAAASEALISSLWPHVVRAKGHPVSLRRGKTDEERILFLLLGSAVA